MKKRILMILLGAVLVMVPGSGFAQETDETTTKRQEIEQKVEQKQQEREAALSERQAKRCEFVQVRLEAHKQRIEARVDARLTRYQKIIDRLNVLALRIENNDGDATELRAAIAELSDLISEFEVDYRLYIAEVQDALNTACGDSVVTKNVVGKALSALRTAKADAADIRVFVKDELKPLLQELRAEYNTEDDDEATQTQPETNTTQEEQ